MEILADLYSAGPRAFESILLPCARMMKLEQAELELSGCFSLVVFRCFSWMQAAMVMVIGSQGNGFIFFFHTKHFLLLILQCLAQLHFSRTGLLSSCCKLFLLTMCTPCWRDSTAGVAVLLLPAGKMEKSGEGTLNLLPRQ